MRHIKIYKILLKIKMKWLTKLLEIFLIKNENKNSS